MKNPHWGAQMDSFCKVWQKKYIEYQWLVHHSPAAVSSYKYVCVWEIREWNQSWNTEGVSMLQTVLTGGPSSLSKPSPHTLPTLEFWNLWVLHPTIFVIFWNQQANKHGQLGMVTATGQVCVGVKKLWMLFFFYSSHNHYHSRFIQGEIIGQQIFHPIFEKWPNGYKHFRLHTCLDKANLFASYWTLKHPSTSSTKENVCTERHVVCVYSIWDSLPFKTEWILHWI